MKEREHFRFFAVLLVLAVVGILLTRKDMAPPARPSVRIEGGTMGTYYLVTLAGVELSSVEEARIREIIEQELRAVNAAMSTYIPDSEISRFNRWDSDEPFPISDRFREVMRASFDLYESMDRVMDPTVGPLVNLWGFGEAGEKEEEPEAEALAAARDVVGLHKLELTGAGLRRLVPGVQLNLSAIAKGYGVDRLLSLLTAEGFVDVYVEIGGDLAVRGRNPQGRPWRIGIQVPEPDSWDDVELILGLDYGAIATSGDYRNFRDQAEGRIHHILDPRTGRPARSSLASVSVYAADCMTADGIATGLFVLGTEAGLAWVEGRPGVEALFIERLPNGRFRHHQSSGFGRLVQ